MSPANLEVAAKAALARRMQRHPNMEADDSTLLLRARPADPTPDWVGNPLAKPATTPPSSRPPWAATTPVPFDPQAEETACALDAPARVRLQLVARDAALRGALAGDARWRGALDASSTAGAASEARAVCDLLAHNDPTGASDLEAVIRTGEHRGRRLVEILAGELELELDPLERLRSTIAVMLPFAASDRDVALALHDGRTLLRASPAVSAERAIEATNTLWRALCVPEQEQRRLRDLLDKGLVARRAFRKAGPAAPDHVHASMLLAGTSTRLACLVGVEMISSVALAPRLRCRAFVAISAPAALAELGPMSGWVLAFAKDLETEMGHTSCESVTS